MFDASWAIPLEVLARLESLSLVRESIIGAGLGSIILATCHMRVIDFSSMDNLWESAFKVALSTGELPQQVIPEVVPTITEASKAMPRAINAHFLTREAFLWSSLQQVNLTIPITDLTLKYGGTVSGSWNVVYILDAWADTGDAPDTKRWSGGLMIDGILAAMHGLRMLMGRPSAWVGITPLMIFRSVSGWIPTTPAES